MILLDTDHFSVFTDERDARHEQLNRRMEAAGDELACTIVSVEEMMRGWMALIHRLRDVHRQLPAYARLREFLDVLAEWEVVEFDAAAADQYVSLHQQRTRIGTMDLKIAAIALVHDALLVTANLRDFRRVPQLRCEDWLGR